MPDNIVPELSSNDLRLPWFIGKMHAAVIDGTQQVKRLGHFDAMRFHITKPFLGAFLDFQIFLLGFFPCQCFIAESFPTLPYGAPVRRRWARVFCGSHPIVDRRGARHPQHLGDVLAGHAGPNERHGLRLQRRIVMAPGPAGSPLVRRVAPVQPLVQRLARGISQPAHRARHRPAALLDRFDGPALLLFRVARHSRNPNRTDSVQLFVRVPQPTKLMRREAEATGDLLAAAADEAVLRTIDRMAGPRSRWLPPG